MSGRYRYSFEVDGVPMLDEEASIIAEGEKRYNIIMISNPLQHSDQLPNPEEICLRNACLMDDGVWSLSSSIEVNNIIKVLDLSYNQISDDGISAIAACVPKMNNLETLKLNGNGFGYDGVRFLVKELKLSNVIKRLELASNNLGDDSAASLADLLIHHESLLELYVDGCYIGDDGADDLGKGLLKNRYISCIIYWFAVKAITIVTLSVQGSVIIIIKCKSNFTKRI